MENIAGFRFFIHHFIVLILPLLLLIALGIMNYFFVYKKNTKRLNTVIGSNRIKPQRNRFVFSWLSYCMIPCLLWMLPFSIILWLIEKDISFVYIISASIVCTMLFAFLFLSLYAYPYYILAISTEKINGATKWGWLWKRTEIRLDEIDTEKLTQRQFGTLLGIKIIHSIDNTKIMTLGLSKEQISEIIMLASNT